MEEKGTPIFQVLVFDERDNWDTLLALGKPFLDKPGLDRLRTVLENECETVVVERHYIDKDYRDTFSQFHSKRFTTPDARCLRLHFFDRRVDEGSISRGDDEVSSGYLGYAVIRPTHPNCVGRTLLGHSLRLERRAHVSVCTEKVLLLGRRLDVEGFPFISKDGDATVCAESALWMLFRYYSNCYSVYSEIRPFEIANYANHHAIGHRVYPSSGLYSWQLAEAMRLHGFAPVIYSRRQYRETFDHLLYTYIESGLPLLVTVDSHVFAAFGHWSDYTKSFPEDDASPPVYSSHFNEALIVNDDNRYPYQALRRHGPRDDHDSEYDWGKIEEFIVPLPEKAFLSAENVRSLIESLLEGKKRGLESSPRLRKRKVVRRLFLTSSRAFKARLRDRGMGNSLAECTYRRLPMPHFIWVCEFAEWDVYRKDYRILGEVVWDATRNEHEPDGWLVIHYPEKMIVNEGAAKNHDSYSDVQELILLDSEPYLLFTSNLNSLKGVVHA